MLEKLNDPIVYEVVGRTLVNTVKLFIVTSLFIAAQKALYAQSNNLIESVDQGIAKLSE